MIVALVKVLGFLITEGMENVEHYKMVVLRERAPWQPTGSGGRRGRARGGSSAGADGVFGAMETYLCFWCQSASVCFSEVDKQAHSIVLTSGKSRDGCHITEARVVRGRREWAEGILSKKRCSLCQLCQFILEMTCAHITAPLIYITTADHVGLLRSFSVAGTLSPLDSFAGELGVQFPHRLEAPHVINVAKQCLVTSVGYFSGVSLDSRCGGKMVETAVHFSRLSGRVESRARQRTEWRID